jgi:hypothetical protein
MFLLSVLNKEHSFPRLPPKLPGYCHTARPTPIFQVPPYQYIQYQVA